jgi:ankyrin repeat protein
MVRSLAAKEQVELNADDPEGYSPFARYALSQKFDMAIRLLHRGADINFTNMDGKSALTLAVESEIHPTVKFLLEKGADPHIEDIQGRDACDYSRMASDALAYRVLLPDCRGELRKKSI